MAGSWSNIHCYLCNGRGHPEKECHLRKLKVAVKNKSQDGRACPAQPEFELIIPGLSGVTVRDRANDEYEVGMFGVNVTSDELRIMVFGNRISFFAQPTRAREFTVLLPEMRPEVNFSWAYERLAVNGRYAFSKNLFRATMQTDPFVHGEAEFTLLGRGTKTNQLVLEYGPIEKEQYRINIDGRGPYGRCHRQCMNTWFIGVQLPRALSTNQTQGTKRPTTPKSASRKKIWPRVAATAE